MRMVALWVVLGTTGVLAGEPVACRVRALTAAEHKAQAAAKERLLPLFTEVQALPTGYAFKLLPASMADLPTWLTREQKCCPFLRLTLKFVPRSEEVWVEATGEDPDAKDFVHSMLVEELQQRGVKGAR